MVCREGLAVAGCAQHTETEGVLRPRAAAVSHVKLPALQLILNAIYFEVYYTGDETFKYTLMTGFKVRPTRLSGVVMVAQLR